jgi:hypothetical protein
MINEKATQEVFGYTSKELAKFSQKKVIATCIQCNKDRIITKAAAAKNTTNFCNNCQRSNHIKKVRHDPTGTKHSQETKEKIRQSHLALDLKGEKSASFGKKRSAAHKQKIAEACRKRVWTIEAKEKLSKKHKGKKLTQEHKNKIGESQKGQLSHRYGKPALHGKGEYYAKGQEKIWMRSYWETQVAKYLDDNNYTWTYEAEVFPITYSNKEGTYRPDFKIYLPDRIEYWEIKGFWRDDAKEKFEAFNSQYKVNVKLLQKEDLEALNIKLRK